VHRSRQLIRDALRDHKCLTPQALFAERLKYSFASSQFHVGRGDLSDRGSPACELLEPNG
jgi:hypothetical protein